MRWGYNPALTGWALNAVAGVLKVGVLSPKEGRQCDHGGRDWSDAPKECWQPQKLEEARILDSFLEALEGVQLY